jgi:fructokinase/2-dehydro-3-deoxygluconokinase
MITPDVLESAGWLHTTGLCLREEPVRSAQLKAMRLAREAGIPVSLDLNLRLETWGLDKTIRKPFNQAVSLADVVFGSGRDEILPFTGMDTIRKGAEELSAGERIVIARMGSEGALTVGPGEFFSSPAFEVDLVDTLGAGDAFNGGFICAQLDSKNLEESVRWGNAVAGLKIGQSGARGLPDSKELIGFLEGAASGL